MQLPNVSFLCTAKVTSIFLLPLANVMKSATGSWDAIFLVAAATNVIVVLLLLFVLRPMRDRSVTAGADRRALPGLESKVAAAPSV